MTTSAYPESAAIRARLLADHHRDLDRQFEELVTRARAGDGGDLRCEWIAFERELLRHLDVEEAEILPGFAQHDPGGAQAILADHAAIRREVLEMGMSLDLHLVRAEAIEGFVRRLKEHARREEMTLYEWAGPHVEPARWRSIGRHLIDLAQDRRPTTPKGFPGR